MLEDGPLNSRIHLNSDRTTHLLRTVVVAITLIGWLVLANHCALGLATQRAELKKEHQCCHNGSSLPSQKPLDGRQGLNCCKSLHLVAPETAKLVVLKLALFANAPVAWIEHRNFESSAVLVATGDTGPPSRVLSFSELVLHRSLRSHAPPSLA